MTQSLAATIRRHVEEIGWNPTAIRLHPDDVWPVNRALFEQRWQPWWDIEFEGDNDVPRGCYRLRFAKEGE